MIENRVSETAFLAACLAYKRKTSSSKSVIGLRISKAVLEAFSRYFEVSTEEAVNRIDQIAKSGTWDAVFGRDNHVSSLYRPGERACGASMLAGILPLIGQTGYEA